MVASNHVKRKNALDRPFGLENIQGNGLSSDCQDWPLCPAALDYTRRQAEGAASRAAAAIADLPESDYKQSLLQLCTFAVDRNH